MDARVLVQRTARLAVDLHPSRSCDALDGVREELDAQLLKCARTPSASNAGCAGFHVQRVSTAFLFQPTVLACAVMCGRSVCAGACQPVVASASQAVQAVKAWV